MKRGLIIAALLLGFLCPAAAFWQSRDSNYNVAVSGGGGGGYQGPGDVVSGAVAFYSCRAYSLAKAGTKAYRIIRASDSTQTDINSLASGLCDTTTPATFCNATTCKIVTYYDQSGALACAGSTACDVTQATSANQPAWTASSLNGWPCATSVAASGMASANALASAQPYTFSTLANRNANFTTVQRFFSSGGGSVTFGPRNVANTVGFAGSTLTATASDSAFHAIVAVDVATPGTSSIVVDGVATTGTAVPGSVPLANSIVILNDQSIGASGLTGLFCEGGVWLSALNATQYGNLNTNMHSATLGWNF